MIRCGVLVTIMQQLQFGCQASLASDFLTDAMTDLSKNHESLGFDEDYLNRFGNSMFEFFQDWRQNEPERVRYFEGLFHEYALEYQSKEITRTD